jgi:hypothetical protein
MFDVAALLERQARWQRSRSKLSWAEKIHMVEALRDTAVRLRAGGRSASQQDGAGCRVEIPDPEQANRVTTATERPMR